MFGLEPLSYSEAVSLFPSVAESTSNPKQSVIPQLNEPSSSSSSAVAQMYNAEMPMPMSMAFEEGLGGAATPDFAFIDDTLSMWQNAPTSFRCVFGRLRAIVQDRLIDALRMSAL